jgi:CHAT domain-containing protein
MGFFPAACLCAVLAAQVPETVDALRRLAATDGNERAIAAVAREHPDSLREAIARSFAEAAGRSADTESAELAAARRLADGYARAWDDPFFQREVARFARWTPEQRRARVDMDSLRRAGIAAFGREGVPAALGLWRDALARVASIDEAGRAVALVSVGGGFYLSGELDSASVYLARARDLATRTGDVRTLGNAIGILASIARDQGHTARAVGLYEQASRLRERSGDRRGLAADQNNLGLIALELGDLDEARRAFARALELNRRDDRRRLVALNLTNLAEIASVRGEYARADSLYREALAINLADGDVAETGFVLHDLGLLATRRGQYAEARAALGEALRIHEQAGASVEAIAVRRDLAVVQGAMGDLQGALITLRRAERDAEGELETPSLRASLALTAADLAVQLNALAEAEAGYARAERLYRAAGDDGGRAEAQHGRALLLYLRQNHEGALRLLELAARTHAGRGDERAAALTRLLTGHVQQETGDTAAARASFNRALVALETVGDVVGQGAALAALGGLEAARGGALAAEQRYDQAFGALGDRPAPDLRWRLDARMAEALYSRGAIEPAIRHLRAAIAAIEETAGGLRIEERRVGYLADKWHVYASLALVEQEQGRPGKALAASERMRARQMRDLLARGQVPTRREVAAREQDLRRSITELMRAIEGDVPALSDGREPRLADRSTHAARESLARVQREYADLLLELRELDPTHARLVTGEVAPWQAVAARLEPDQVLLQYLITDTRSTVFVVTTDTVQALDLDNGRGELGSLVEFARRAMDRPGTSPATSLWRTPLRRLYHHLVEPVERAGLLEGKRRLVIVPHGELHFLPFSALLHHDGVRDRFLVERFELSYAPSATVWLQLAEREAVPPAGGVLALAPRPAALPASRDEVQAIRRIYGPRATLLMGRAATKRALRDAAPDHSILHLATFGILNKHNPLFSFVELAPAEGNDGRLEVHEVHGLQLAGQLVVLSACQTALGSGAVGDVPPGDDWVGLVQAFLYAGAGSVLASLWPVEDRATAQLMAHFYRRLAAGASEAEALAGAQRAMLGDRATVHPFRWAGFVLVAGAGG